MNNGFTRTGFEDFRSVFGGFFPESLAPGRSLMADAFKIDIEEKENEYLIEAELPGVEKQEIDINVEEDSLSITVNRAENAEKQGKNYVHKERRSSSMSRWVRLSMVDTEQIKASLENGVLSITVPKNTTQNSARKIEIM